MMNKMSTFPTETGSTPCMHGSSHSPGLNAPSSHSPSSPMQWGRCTGGTSRPPGAPKTGREVGCEHKAVHRASRESLALFLQLNTLPPYALDTLSPESPRWMETQFQKNLHPDSWCLSTPRLSMQACSIQLLYLSGELILLFVSSKSLMSVKAY